VAEGPRLSQVVERLAAASRNEPVWITVGTLVDGASTTALREAHLVYDAETIRHVGDRDHPPPRECLSPGRSEPDVRLPRWTVLPGLLDAHAHLFLEGGELDLERRRRHVRRTAAELLADARRRAQRLVGLGVMGVRDAGDARGVGLALSQECRAPRRDSSEAVLPWVESPGAAIHHRGSYGRFIGEPIEDHTSLEACVESRIRSGAQRVKLMVSGLIDFEKGRVDVPAPMSAAEVRTLCAAARARGRAAFAHASGREGIDNALAGDVESVEHGFFVTHEQLARMRDRRIAWVPTFAPVRAQLELADVLGWRPPTIDQIRSILDEHAESLRHAAETGVIVLAGSDAGSIGVAHGRGLLRELELMERAGMRSLDVLNSATGVSATHLGLDHQLGCLRTGHRPRMILTERDPLESVTHLGQDEIRLFDGRVLSAPHPDPPGL